MTTKRALSRPIVTVCVSLLFFTQRSNGEPHGRLSNRYRPQQSPPSGRCLRKDHGWKIDWRRFRAWMPRRSKWWTATGGNRCRLQAWRCWTAARPRPLARRRSSWRSKGRVETVLPDYSAYVSAKFVQE